MAGDGALPSTENHAACGIRGTVLATWLRYLSLLRSVTFVIVLRWRVTLIVHCGNRTTYYYSIQVVASLERGGRQVQRM